MKLPRELVLAIRGQTPVVGIVLTLALVPMLTQDSYVVGVWTFIQLNILVVIGLDILLGYAGQLSLGHGAFVAIGAYTSALLTTKAGWTGWASIPIGMVVAALLAAIIAVPTLRLRGYYLAVTTLGFPIVFDAIVRVSTTWSGGSSGLTAIPRLEIGQLVFRDPVHYYYLVLSILAAVLLLVWNLVQSRYGLKLRAIHADETAAAARGIAVVPIKIAVFTLSAAIAALSGSLYVHNVQFVAPTTFGLHYSLMLVIMLVAGGMGRIWGGVLGVVVLGWLPELLRDAATWQPVIFGSLLALIMLFSPNGLAGLFERRSSFVRRYGKPAPVPAVPAGEPLLEVRGLEKRYGGVIAVHGLDFAIRTGEIRSIIGPNGAGKSTALALISGALDANGGNIRFGGQDISSLAPNHRAQIGLARTFQHARLISTLTVLENIVVGTSVSGSTRHDDELRATEVLELLGLDKIADCFPGDINHYQRRLTEIGVVLAANPKLMLLDEPAAGLSEVEVKHLLGVLDAQRRNGTAIVLVDHIMALVLPLSDGILVLDGGTPIADGIPSKILADPKVRAAYLGERGSDA